MKSIARIAAFAILGVAFQAALSQQPTPPKPPVAEVSKPPVIPPDALKQYWRADDAQQRAQREVEHAQADSQAANDQWKAAVKALNDSCGDKYAVKQDVAGQDPYCGTKPAEPAKK